LEAFFHVKLIGAVRKRWNAAELAHGLSFPSSSREIEMDKETAKMAVSRCVMDRMEREKESNATMGCLAGLFYVWIFCRGAG